MACVLVVARLWVTYKRLVQSAIFEVICKIYALNLYVQVERSVLFVIKKGFVYDKTELKTTGPEFALFANSVYMCMCACGH